MNDLFPDFAKATAQGQSNALRVIQARQAGNAMRREDLMTNTAKQASSGGSYDPEQHAKLLESNGLMREAFDLRKLARSEANAKSQNSLNQTKQVSETMKLLAVSAPLIQNQQQYDNLKSGIEGFEIIPKGVLPEIWDANTQSTLSQLGKAAADKYTTITGKQVQGLGFAEGTVLQRNDTTGKTSVLQSPDKKKDDGFTLSQGQKRFDSNGKFVASVDPKAVEVKPPAGFRFTVKGDLEPIPGGPKDAAVTPGQKAVDKEFAKEYTQFVAAGGFADIEKQLRQLKTVSDDLSDKNLTGGLLGRTPDFLKQAFGFSDAISARELVEEVVQRNLRLVLGAQFTEKEGERLIARAFNPRLDESENKKRVDRLIVQIRKAAKSKSDASKYFEENGTLTGWQGDLPSLSDFDNLDSGFSINAQDKSGDTGFTQEVIDKSNDTGFSNPPRATNSQTGQVIEWDGQQWVPVQ